MSKKVAIIGARGISNWGGFETAAREIAPRLVERGYDVYCSCEKNSCNLDTYKGVKMIYFPIRMPKNYELRKIFEVLYDLYFMIRCPTALNCDIIYSLGYNANLLTLFPRLFRKKIVFNVAGVEWERSKFGKVQQKLVRLLFVLASVGTHHIIIDHEKLKSYVPSRYRDKVVYLSYGADEQIVPPWDTRRLTDHAGSKEALNISPNEYWLVVARLEPDQQIRTIVDAYLQSTSTKPLVVVGDFSSEKYEQAVTEALQNVPRDKRVIFTGGIYDQDLLTMLRHNCFAYIHGHSKGGTNPSLLEAMINRKTIIADGNKFNRGVCRDFALYFKNPDELQYQMGMIESDPWKYVEMRNKAYERVRAEYSWDKVADQYDAFFALLLGNESASRSAESVVALTKT
jgi:rhamnosyltransferase